MITNEYVKKIVVYAPEKLDSKLFQKMNIIFKFVEKSIFLLSCRENRKNGIDIVMGL